MRRLISILVLALAGPVAAHTLSPDSVIEKLNASEAKSYGVVRARRDERAPRLLLIWVGDAWYKLPPQARRQEAAQWREEWRHAEYQGAVAVLDAKSWSPVVHYGPGGMVTGVDSEGDIRDTSTP
jgi:hypothetical protein